MSCSRSSPADGSTSSCRRTSIPEQKKVNAGLLDLAKELALPLVATNDCHYLNQEDARAHEVLLCIQTGKTMNDPDRMRFSTDEFYFKSPEEMDGALRRLPGGAAQHGRDRRALQPGAGASANSSFPSSRCPRGRAWTASSRSPRRKGLEDRLARAEGVRPATSRWPPNSTGSAWRKKLGMIQKMGFAGYFLIVADFIRYAKIQRHPGRAGPGLGAGSLVAYASGITDIDPLAYDLLFERFLNPERVSPPDIDIDFCIQGRDEVIQYVTQQVRPGQRRPDHHLRDDGGPGRDPRRGPGAGHALRRGGPDRQADPQHPEHHPGGGARAGARG